MAHFGRRNDFLQVDYNKERRRLQQPEEVAQEVNSNVPEGLLKAARASGVLNLTNKNLTHLPPTVWRVVLDSGKTNGDISMDNNSKDNWWDFQEIKKLILNDNKLVGLSEDIQLLPYLSVLDARDNEFTQLPESMSELKELRVLNVAKNKLTSLQSSICLCSSLASINLSGNLIDRISSDIGSLTKLSDLDLSDNKLMLLPPELGMLDSLRTLNLENNCLTELPDNLGNLSNLVNLNLNKNKLSNINWNANSFRSLEVFEASENLLLRLPLFRNASTLKVLRLSHNSISSLPGESFTSLTSLKQLDLRRNKIQELPEEVTKLRELERLDLTDNDLSSLPFELGNMPSLNVLSVEGNPLRTVRFDVICKGTMALKKYLASRLLCAEDTSQEPVIRTTMQCSSGVIGAHVDIDINEVRTTKLLRYADKRQGTIPNSIFEAVLDVTFNKVDFQNNDLEVLPDGLFERDIADRIDDLCLKKNCFRELDVRIGNCMGKLTILDLSMNSLTDIPMEISQLKLLRELVLTQNLLQCIPGPVFALQNLENLLLSTNKIEDIDSIALKKMNKLSTLDLSNNNIRQLPPELGLCTQIKSLHLEGNSFRVPRHAVLAKGTTEVLDYLRNRIVQ